MTHETPIAEGDAVPTTPPEERSFKEVVTELERERDALQRDLDTTRKRLKRAGQDMAFARRVITAITSEHTAMFEDRQDVEGSLQVLDRLLHDAVNAAVNDFVPLDDVDDIPF